MNAPKQSWHCWKRRASAFRVGFWLVIAAVSTAGPAFAYEGEQGGLADAGVIQTVPLDSGKPLFVPTHARVATTVRFPGAIGAPEGRGFTEDDSKKPGEYLIAWTPGESHFTLTPLAGAAALNLNVPYHGLTYVLYFYPAATQFHAVASLNLIESEKRGAPSSPAISDRTASKPAAPGRWMGLLDKLKVLRAAAPGLGVERLAAGLGVECRDGSAAGESDSNVFNERSHGRFTIRVLRVVRDPRLGAFGFAVLLRNTSERTLALDVASFEVRSKGLTIPQVMSDAPALISPKGEVEAYFIADDPRAHRLKIENPWQITVALVEPAGSLLSSMIGEFARSSEKKADAVR